MKRQSILLFAIASMALAACVKDQPSVTPAATEGRLVIGMHQDSFGGDCEPRFYFDDKSGLNLSHAEIHYTATKKNGEAKDCTDIVDLPGGAGSVFCSLAEPASCDAYESIVITRLTCTGSGAPPDCRTIAVVTGDPLLSIAP